MKPILFLVPYPLNEAPSQRFRFEQYWQHLTDQGFTFVIQSFLPDKHWKIFYRKGNTILKLYILISGFFKRIFILFQVPRFDFVFIHRELTPIGPPIFEWIIGRVLKKKIIYDFDDSIWLTDSTHEPPLVRVLKWRSKVKRICALSYKVSCGNAYLCSFASAVARQVILNPTTIDTSHHESSRKTLVKDQVTIGWTGSHSTLKYLQLIENVLRTIISEHPFVKIVVISDRAPDLQLPFEFIPWRKETEITDLSRLDIGLMPLPDDEWSKGKCGFKALQYMALEIPAVASPVGVNSQIIKDGVSGFLCDTEEQWMSKLTHLINNKELRETLGRAGQEEVKKRYSVLSNARNFLSLFE